MEQESTLAIDFAMHLMWFFHLGHKGQAVPSEISNFWSSVTDAIYAACSERMESLSPSHLAVCSEAFKRQKIGIIELRKWHGTEAVFLSVPSLVFPRFWSLSSAQTLLTLVAFSSPSVGTEGTGWELLQLRELARTLPHCPTPWVRRAVEKHLTFPTWVLEVSEEKRKHIKRKP
jgi:hypothetical protein